MSTMTITPEQTAPLSVTGNGLITGLPSQVSIQKTPPGTGITFRYNGETLISGNLAHVVHTDRGVTLGEIKDGRPTGKTLSIVEHFLCGCTLSGHSDLQVDVVGPPELPLLDGSSGEWVKLLNAHFGVQPKIASDIDLPTAVYFEQDERTKIYAIPAEQFQATYTMDFEHPGLKERWVRWDSATDEISTIAESRTFGFLRELPMLQASGLAKGVTLENTLGLTDEGGYTSELRHDDEPMYHKILDLIGDLTLMGINPLRLKAHIFAINAGHTSHTQFAKKLLATLQTK